MGAVVSVRVVDLIQLMFGLDVADDLAPILSNEVLEFEDKLEDLVQVDLHPILSLGQEALLQNIVQELIVFLHQLLKEIDLGQMLLEHGPLG